MVRRGTRSLAERKEHTPRADQEVPADAEGHRGDIEDTEAASASLRIEKVADELRFRSGWPSPPSIQPPASFVPAAGSGDKTPKDAEPATTAEKAPEVKECREGCVSNLLVESVTRMKDQEESPGGAMPPGAEGSTAGSSMDAPAGVVSEAPAAARRQADNGTTAAAAALGGAAGWIGPAAVVGPLAIAGGPMLGLGVAGFMAYGAAYRPEGDTWGDFSRQLGAKGVEASKCLGRKGAEVAVCAQERLENLDEEHEISEKAKRAGKKALEDVKELGQKSADELKGLWAGLWGTVRPATRTEGSPQQPAAGVVWGFEERQPTPHERALPVPFA